MPTATSTTTTSKVNFFVAPLAHDEPAYTYINTNPKTGEREKNYAEELKEVVFENLRGKESEFTLDSAGFQLVRQPAKHTTFVDDEEIQRDYYAESIDLLKSVTGARKVVIFDHTIRRRVPGSLIDTPTTRQPVAQAHVDQTTKASIARVHHHLPADEAPELLKRRFQIINLWRPISQPALDWPLGLCDYRSIDPTEDTAPITLVYPDREGETLGVKYNPNQKWMYFRAVTPEEAILIKCFDSVQDGSVAVFTPHTGFEDPSTPAGVPTATTTTTTGRVDFFVVPPAHGERAYIQTYTDPKAGVRERHYTEEDKEVIFENLRGTSKESDLTLDSAGFQLVRQSKKHTAFRDDAEIQKEYYSESV
ncbi:hypothetical protein H0H87_002728 [Tephrocybe sp. NHM501043]|nr:hypothetical protein H0H87_002728 [Tephrocybe sp. NHM501043]